MLGIPDITPDFGAATGSLNLKAHQVPVGIDAASATSAVSAEARSGQIRPRAPPDHQGWRPADVQPEPGTTPATSRPDSVRLSRSQARHRLLGLRPALPLCDHPGRQNDNVGLWQLRRIRPNESTFVASAGPIAELHHTSRHLDDDQLAVILAESSEPDLEDEDQAPGKSPGWSCSRPRPIQDGRSASL